MVTKNTNADKDAGRTDYQTDKQAVITIEVPGDGARTVEAQHYIKSNDGTISIYLGPRSAGIDIQMHVTRCVIDRVDTHEDAEDEEPRLVTDGGRDMYGTECDGHNCITPVTDSDRDLCKTCRARQVATASMTGFDDDDGNVEDLDIDLPDALSPDTDDDDENRDDDPELVTDGGIELTSGDDVLHAGEQWRVARSDGARVEIYQLGARSLIVPTDTVEPLPEVRA